LPLPVHNVCFGPFQLDLNTAELRNNGITTKLAEQPFQILAELVEHPGELVTRDELRQRLWHSDTFVDFEHGLNAAIKRLREILGDSAENPRYIETVPRRGYRLIVSVESLAAALEQSELVPPSAGTPAESKNLAGWPKRSAIAACVVIALAGLGTWYLRSSMAARPIKSLAVLPVKNFSGDASQELFADGMTDALIADLAQIEAVKVISTTSAMHYKGTNETLPQIARELGVDALVEASMMRSGDRVRLTVQLIDARDRHLWVRSYERQMTDVLRLQSDLVQAIAGEIRVQVTSQEQARLARARPVSPEAYEAYLKGRYYWNLRTNDGRRKSLEYFQQAIEMDPGYALAYAGMADSYIVLGEAYLLAPQEAFPRATAAALKALELDETLGEPHASLGAAKADYDWDWEGADKEYRRAIELNPGYATAHQWFAEYLSEIGRPDEAIAEIKRAHESDPLSPVISAVVGNVFIDARRYDEAIAQCRRTLELNPEFWVAHLCLGMAYGQENLYQQAISEYEKITGISIAFWSQGLPRAYLAVGKRDEALRILSEMRELAMRGDAPAYLRMAEIYTALGDFDQAFAWLEKAYGARYHGLVNDLKVGPLFDPLHSDPRFQDLLRRMNFPQQDPARDILILKEAKAEYAKLQ